jgi:hypothetical protein
LRGRPWAAATSAALAARQRRGHDIPQAAAALCQGNARASPLPVRTESHAPPRGSTHPLRARRHPPAARGAPSPARRASRPPPATAPRGGAR